MHGLCILCTNATLVQKAYYVQMAVARDAHVASGCITGGHWATVAAAAADSPTTYIRLTKTLTFVSYMSMTQNTYPF